MNESIDVFAEKDEENDESKRAAEVFAILKVCVRAGIYHEFFRESGLGEMGLFWASVRQRVMEERRVHLQICFIGEYLAFVNIRAMRILSVAKE